ISEAQYSTACALARATSGGRSISHSVSLGWCGPGPLRMSPPKLHHSIGVQEGLPPSELVVRNWLGTRSLSVSLVMILPTSRNLFQSQVSSGSGCPACWKSSLLTYI